ncbi:RTA1 domain-containing protein [Aspergillus mulundensis]|uniref:Uncharacterized protein n=1 Tax=Aspergillus mulundensis TaxID=1810919 RepID=A0A3D8SCG9_9EURO|nr:Uncharacterized protein DSM5745_04351 [Aspergillus mulundensis]RDW84025.1 Uncharacterized protein DSM5745_04351 [Aspergillus mulundensis]
MYIKNPDLTKRDTDSDDEDWSLFFFTPSLAAAILFAVLYLIPLIYHSYISCVAYKKTSNKYFRYSFSAPIIIATLIEINGYAQRSASTQSVQDIGLFATSQTMIVLAPVLVCASLYVLLGRVIRSTCSPQPQPQGHGQDRGGRRRRRRTGTGTGIAREEEGRASEKAADAKVAGFIRISHLPKIFITLDVAAMLTQGGGSAIAASGEWEGTLEEIGTGVLIGGLALQVATFSAFLAVVIKFHRRVLERREEGMRMVLRGVYIAGFFIMVRSIFRLIEFALGTESYVMTHEWPLYVLEAVPMLIAFMVLGWYHPSRWLSAEASGESKARAWYERHRGGFFQK